MYWLRVVFFFCFCFVNTISLRKYFFFPPNTPYNLLLHPDLFFLFCVFVLFNKIASLVMILSEVGVIYTPLSLYT